MVGKIIWCGITSANYFLTDENMRDLNKKYFDSHKRESEGFILSEIKWALREYLFNNKDKNNNFSINVSDIHDTVEKLCDNLYDSIKTQR